MAGPFSLESGSDAPLFVTTFGDSTDGHFFTVDGQTFLYSRRLGISLQWTDRHFLTVAGKDMQCRMDGKDIQSRIDRQNVLI